MNGELTLGISYFGKLPSRGDFVKAASNNHSLVATLDQWAGQGLELLAQDVAWKQLHDLGHAVNFALLNSRGHIAIAGHLLPSMDASGRRFPFMAAVSMEVPQPLAFLSRSPLAFARVWARLERDSRTIHAASDPTQALADLADIRANVNVLYETLNPAFQDFLEMQTLQSLHELLAQPGREVSIQRILLGLGILLQPVMSRAATRIGKGLLLPLPSDALYRNLVSTLWLDALSGFLARTELEVLVLQQHGPQPALAISFAGLQGRALQAMFDPRIRDADYIELTSPAWADEHVAGNPTLRKLASYTEQPGLALRTARNTFRETFLGV